MAAEPVEKQRYKTCGHPVTRSRATGLVVLCALCTRYWDEPFFGLPYELTATGRTEMAEKDQKIATLERQVSEMNAKMMAFMAQGSQPRTSQLPPGFDVQSSQIANVMAQQEFEQRPVNFTQSITSPDLSGEVQRKPRSDKGVPRGPRKES